MNFRKLNDFFFFFKLIQYVSAMLNKIEPKKKKTHKVTDMSSVIKCCHPQFDLIKGKNSNIC